MQSYFYEMQSWNYNLCYYSCFMKKLCNLLVACLVFLTVASSCSSSEGVSELLRTVPSNASWVAVIDLNAAGDISVSDRESMAAGLVADYAGIPDGKDLNLRGIEADFGVAFGWEDLAVASAMLKSESEFRESLEKSGVSFRESDGFQVSSNGRIIIGEGRLWLCSSALGTSNVERFLATPEDKSFAAHPYTATLEEGKFPIAFIVDFGKLISRGGMGATSNMNMLWGSIFNDPKYLAGSMTMDKDKLTLNCKVLDPKCRPASKSLDLAELDPSELDFIPGGMGIYLGLALGQTDLELLSSQFASSLPGDFGEPLRHARGQLTGAISSGTDYDFDEESEDDSTIFFTLDFADASSASGMASGVRGLTGYSARTQGTRLFVGSAADSGSKVPDAVKNAFKGAVFALAVYPDAEAGAGSNPFREIVLRAVPDGKSLDFELTAVPGKNGDILPGTLMQMILK